LGVGRENGEREFQEQVGRRASIPVRLEKIRGKERYRLVMDDELGRLLVSRSVVRGKKRKKKFSDVCLGFRSFLSIYSHCMK
jgi:sterol O-acyltransferase